MVLTGNCKKLMEGRYISIRNAKIIRKIKIKRKITILKWFRMMQNICIILLKKKKLESLDQKLLKLMMPLKFYNKIKRKKMNKKQKIEIL